MAKFRSIKNSLIAGEISPTADGRTDLTSYAHACKTMRNMIPFAAGGAYIRPGTIYQGQETFANYAAPWEYPFVASDGVEYMIVAYPRRSGGTTATLRIYEAQQGSPAEAFAKSDILTSLPVGPLTLNWTRQDFEDSAYLQTGDILNIVTPNKKPIQVVMVGVGNFVLYDGIGVTLSGTDLRDAWPYKAQNTTAFTFTASAVAGAITVSMSGLVFAATEVGAMIKVDSGGVRGCVQITSAPTQTVPQTFNAQVIVNLGAAGPVTTWWESAWSDAKGWPGTIELYRSRVAYGGNLAFPDSIWLSEQSDYDQLSHEAVLDPDSTPAGAQAFTLTLSAGQRSRITWLKSARSLLVGTKQSEWLVDKESTSTVFGCDNSSAARQSEYGSNGVMAYTGNEVFFVSNDGSIVRSLAFDYNEQAYVADEVHTLYSEFPGAPPLDYYVASQCAREIIHIVWDDTRQTLWCIDNAGNWRGLTRVKKANITLWHSHELGGYDSTSKPALASVDPDHPISQLVCEGAVVGMACITDTYTKKINLWLSVRRKVNGVWIWTIETMRGGYVHSTSAYSQILASQMVFTDCSVVTEAVSSPATYAVAHLEGETVHATANSIGNGLFSLPQGVVTAGVVSNTAMQWLALPSFPGPLDGEYWLAFGYKYQAVVQPVRVEAGSIVGSSQDAVKRVHRAFPRFYKTIAAKVGPDMNRLERVEFHSGSTPMGKSADLYTGDKEILLSSDYDRDGYVFLVQDEPLPFGVTAIVLEGQTYD